MPRILAIDYGKKRCGIAVTDNEQIIATALTTVAAQELMNFLKNYTKNEQVIRFVIGEPKDLNQVQLERWSANPILSLLQQEPSSNLQVSWRLCNHWKAA